MKKICFLLLSLFVLSCQNTKNNLSAKESVNASELKSLIAQKDYSLIYFWTTWCGPCRKTIQETLPELEKSIDQSKVQLLVVAVGKDEEQINSIIGNSGLSSQNFRLDFTGPDISLTHKIVLENTLEDLFPEEKVWRNSVPVFVLADKNGNVINAKVPKGLDEITKVLKL